MLNIGLAVRPIWRNDRFGRGGDHTELLNAGYPAVRFSVAVENYNWQHQDLRVENGIEYGDTIEKVDFPYLTKVVKLNVAALASLARAPMPPEVTVEGAVSTDTTIKWRSGPGVGRWKTYCRRTNAAEWGVCPATATMAFEVTGPADGMLERTAIMRGVRVDDWIFGMSAVSDDGYESPVASAVPGGAFRPYRPPPPPAQ